MANRRMFSLDIVDTDKFLDMPATTQALYFHLGMRADDDGFVAAPKRIAKVIGCNDDDLKLLIAKAYLIPFDNGVVVISDWNVNNWIRPDRKHDTRFLQEMRLLELYNDTYILSKELQPIDNQLTTMCHTEDSIGKDRVSIGKDKERECINYQQIADMYNDTCVSFPRLTKLSDARKKAIRARMKQYTVDDFKKLFEMAEGSSFLKGENGRNWSANFDWLLKDSNMAKVLDGNYQDKDSTSDRGKPKEVNPYENWQPPSYLDGLKGRKPRPDDPFQ